MNNLYFRTETQSNYFQEDKSKVTEVKYSSDLLNLYAKRFGSNFQLTFWQFEMSNPVFWEKYEKYDQIVIC